jgi:hypothetical protein
MINDGRGDDVFTYKHWGSACDSKGDKAKAEADFAKAKELREKP